ncbi:MAG: hypothetical protein AAGF12_28460, partial [Myxococcota bacterium]
MRIAGIGLAFVLVAGCGRLGFGLDGEDIVDGTVELDATVRPEAAPDGDATTGDAMVDAADGDAARPTRVFDPASNGCVMADDGPLVEVGRFETGNLMYGV